MAVPFLLEIQEEAQQEVEASQEDDELQHNYANLKRNGIIKYLADVDDDLPGDAGAGLAVGATTLAFISKPIHSGHALELGTHWNWTRSGTGHALELDTLFCNRYYYITVYHDVARLVDCVAMTRSQT